MKKYMVAVLAAVLCSSAYAAQNTALSNKQVRDPRYLETWLEDNASDAQTRLAAAEVVGTGLITETNRAQVAEGALSTRIVSETNRAQVAEAVISTNGATMLNLNGRNLTYLSAGQSVTNGQVVTLVAGINYLKPVGQANGLTNTITIAAPAGSGTDCQGRLVVVAVDYVSTNALAIADGGGAVWLAGAWVGQAASDSTLTMMALDFQTYLELSRSTND